MPDRPPRVLRFVSAELVRLPEGRCRARVELQHQRGESYVGEVQAAGAEPESLRAAAQAAADAVRQAVGGENSLRVDGVTVTEAFGQRTVFVQVSAVYQGEKRRVVGFCLVDPDPVRAAALAVLNATNRFLGIG